MPVRTAMRANRSAGAGIVGRRCFLALLSTGLGGCVVHVNDETMFPHVPSLGVAERDAFSTTGTTVQPLTVTSEGRRIEA